MRRFAWLTSYALLDLELPKRHSPFSAGYDLAAIEPVFIDPHKVVAIPTGLKVYLPKDEVLLLMLRSSLALKRGLSMANGVGVIDADYVDNQENEGHIQILVYNNLEQTIEIKRGERIAQGVFLKYQKTDDDLPQAEPRQGGFGSTSKL